MDLWNTETPIRDIEGLEIEIPAWIDQDISPSNIAAIVQGGCASGAYMPAVTYHQATATMAAHGDDVLQYLEDRHGELPQPYKSESWSGLAVFYLSIAVEAWAADVESTLESFDPDEVES
jgi:hypothetical protein